MGIKIPPSLLQQQQKKTLCKAFGTLRLAFNYYPPPFDRVRWSSLPRGALRRRYPFSPLGIRDHLRTFNQTGQVCFVVKRTPMYDRTKKQKTKQRRKKRIRCLRPYIV